LAAELVGRNLSHMVPLNSLISIEGLLVSSIKADKEKA
jgi:hypothetical protein